MERVQFQQEQMLAELKDLVLKGLFSEVEIKQIIKRRTEFETALVRRIARKTDYLRYAAYEMDLENLRRKRAARLTSPTTSVSDYSLVRRQFHIFDRAVKKFKSDVGMWTQYIQVAKKMGARALAGKIIARALQLHPNVPSLYILAASHELHSLSTSAARTLLQRGIRLNPDSMQLWTEYVKMELGFIEGLRRRWNVLGLDPESDSKRKQQDEIVKETGTEPSDTQDLDNTEDEGSSSIVRQQIMNGAIVKTVMNNAARALPKVALFRSFQDLISSYPLSQSLRECLLDHLYALLLEHLPDDAQAIALLSREFVKQGVAGTALVEGLKNANENFIKAIRRNCAREDICNEYTGFLNEWCTKDIDGNLKLYLLSSLRSIADEFNEPPELVSKYIGMVASGSSLVAPEKIMPIIRKLAHKGRTTSGDVWIARLEAESRLSSREDSVKAWVDARNCVKGHGAEAVWMWGIDRDVDSHKRGDLMEELLKASMRDSSLRSIHGALVMRYMKELMLAGNGSDETKIIKLQHAAKTYFISSEVWAAVFVQEGSQGSVARWGILRQVFEQWKQVNVREATLSWAEWLIRNGKGKEAKEVVVKERRLLCEEDRKILDERWAKVLDGTQTRTDFPGTTCP